MSFFNHEKQSVVVAALAALQIRPTPCGCERHEKFLAGVEGGIVRELLELKGVVG